MATARTSIGAAATAEAVLEALERHPGTTVTELAEAAGIGRSTASKALAALEDEGKARRLPGGREGGRRRADHWAPPEATTPSRAGKVPSEPAPAERLRPGALGTLVVEYLTTHANEALGPTAVGKALGRSQGAVANLCRSSLSSATADEVAEAVGISASAASEVLASLEREGLVSRSAGGRQGGCRQPDRWSLTGQSPATSSGVRLGRGQLREMLVEHLRAHPGEVSPAQLSKVLEHSAGAISNALVKLADGGEVVQTSEHPRRYAAR